MIKREDNIAMNDTDHMKSITSDNNWRKNTVLLASLGILTALALISAVFPSWFQSATSIVHAKVTHLCGWYYLLLVSAMVFLCVYFIFSPAGAIRLGEPGSRPEYSTPSWLAMLFSAGMGIGIVFFGAAEPLTHFAISAPRATPGTREAMSDALRYSFFHWGIHAWSIYAVVALSIAYFGFRKKERNLLSMTLKPLFGQRMEGPLGKAVDVMSIVATGIGVSTTLGFGAMQIGSGMNYLLGTPSTLSIQIAIIAVSTVLFLISAISGVDRGVQMLSNLNVRLAFVLLAVALCIGPTVLALNAFVDTIGSYLDMFFRMSFRTAAFDDAHHAWIEKWTMFYWAWWLSWSPFVGVFIARISKGRTVREFLFYVLLVPTLFSFLWFSVFGVLATDVYNAYPKLSSLPTEQMLFAVLQSYPLSVPLSTVTVLLIVSFFVTSADSATYVLAMLSENGRLKPSNLLKCVWGVVIACVAGALLAAGGLNGLLNVLMISALPFSFIVIVIMISLFKELRHEQKEMGLYIKPESYPEKGNPIRSYENE